MPSPDAPLAGSCACGTVRFEVTAAFRTAGYCHCTRCQRRAGTPWSMNGMVPTSGFAVVAGADRVRTWQPPDGLSKSFCEVCGGHVYSGDPDAAEGIVGVRFGALHGDPGIRPRWRQWLSSAPDWAPIPDDGLPRFEGRREID
jgi:hypothetical protein